jgi:glutamate dehydrogenase
MSANLASYDQILKKVAAIIDKQLPAKQARLLNTFVQRYYNNVAPEDLGERPPEELYSLMLSHWELLFQRAPREVKLHIYNPTYEQNGWQSTHTVVEVVTDDMPFLVDSLRMEINREGLLTHFINHMGDIQVRRNDQHQVIEILPPDTEKTTGISTEALIYIEIDKQSDPAVLTELKNNLLRILNDVRFAVEDWAKMRERMQEALAELENNPPPLDPVDLAESKDFLRWLYSDHFTFLGYRDYDVIGEGDNAVVKAVASTGIGVLRDQAKSKERPVSSMPPAARAIAQAPQVLVISKTNTKATVHRPVYTDYVGIKRFDKTGKLLGEHRFIGLYTSTAYKSHPKDIPFLRRKIALVMQNSKLSPKGHSGKELLDILASLPRDDLFQASTDELTQLALNILHIQERQQIRAFARQDAYRRFVSCLVYIPREQYNTDLRLALQDVLLEEFHGSEITYSTLFNESTLVRVDFLIRTDPKIELHFDIKKIEAKLAEASRTWKDVLREKIIEHYGEEQGIQLVQKYLRAFPASYRDDFEPCVAVCDIEHLERLNSDHELEMNFYRPVTDLSGSLHLKLFHVPDPIVLSDVLPMLENMGLRVIEEHPHQIEFKDKTHIWIHDFSLQIMHSDELDVDAVKDVFQEAFMRIWRGEAENDGFNRLVLGAQLTWREAVLLRAYTKYLRQIGFTFSQTYIETTLAKNAGIARQLVELFKLWFDPEKQQESAAVVPTLEKSLHTALDAVVNLDEDRILRRLLEVVRATSRTNYFQRDQNGNPKSWLSFKLNPARIADMPLPRPMFEIFVYSPRVEAVHLRAAAVARGGIRWSDRREDFRTEVLGLMKAQQVKNAVIVPSGAKGGFVVKNLPMEGTREAIMHEVVYCYQTFMRGLLDVTDNLHNGETVPPLHTVRYDEDDPYLVVAADKGTATFSDMANAISTEYDFWLGDAFASGGSAGYDHKKIGITARGAWESVKRHFAVLGINPAAQDFTVVGIGDMAGDVFGNGMLRSPHIKLVAAFNGTHIFLDPNPDAATSFAERQRLFNLPRSTWEDYNPILISAGGGVFKRSLKSIPLSTEVKKLLGIAQDHVEPNTLVRALLSAEVDLLWNGGIGTYVKASQERHVDVGDRSNDAVRVNGNQLRCRVVGEGGNLGFTQLARVEYAFNGGRIYTDFIDNSAGVDCSDHEVNCKILLNHIVAAGDLTLKQRNELLAAMTDEVAELVLDDNYQQTRAINLALARVTSELELYRHYLDELERSEKIDRALEFLPDDKTLLERKALGKGLCGPEIAVLMAYSKMLIKAELLQSDIPEDPHFAHVLGKAFPKPLQQRFAAQMQQHSLRREIIATVLSNAMVNAMGITFVFRTQTETNTSVPDIVKAYVIAAKIFGLQEYFELIETMGTTVAAEVQYQMMWHITRLVRRAVRWFLRHRKEYLNNTTATVEHFAPGITAMRDELPNFFIGNEHDRWEAMVESLQAAGVSEMIAKCTANLRRQYALLDIIEAAIENQLAATDLAKIYFALGERMGFSWLREQITGQPVDTRWDVLGRAAMRDDLDAQQRTLAVAVLSDVGTLTDVEGQLDKWFAQHKVFMTRWQQLMTDLRAAPDLKMMMLSVVVRELVGLVRASREASGRKAGKAKRVTA